jgi:ribose transport system permease protein
MPVAALNSKNADLVRLLFKYNAVIVLIVLIIVASLISPVFLSPYNISNVFRQQSTYMLIALGVLMVMLTGGIDLSVSSMAALGSVVVVYFLTKMGFQEYSWGLPGAVVMGILAGFAVGCANGFMVAKLKMPAFIVTLASMYGIKGLSFIITNGNTILLRQTYANNAALVSFAADPDPIFGIPWTVYLMVVVVIVIGLVMHFTAFGRLVTATGSNETAVQLAGINSKKYIFLVYVLSGTLCGLAGVIIASRSGSATALTASVDYDMTTIAAVVIGGASLKGGEGNVPMTVIGVFVLAVIGNIMNLVSLAIYPQMVVKAVIIILAVLLKSINSKATS